MYPSVQNDYGLLTRDPKTDGVFDACEELGIAPRSTRSSPADAAPVDVMSTDPWSRLSLDS